MAYAPNTWTTGDSITADDLNHIEDGIATVDALTQVDDWLSSGITAATGWSMVSQLYRRVGPLAFVYCVIKRTGSTIAVGSSGNIGNNHVCTLPSGFRSTRNYQAMGASGHVGRLASFMTGTDGHVFLCAVSPNDDIGHDDELSFGGVIVTI